MRRPHRIAVAVLVLAGCGAPSSQLPDAPSGPADAAIAPEPPAGLQRWLTGNPTDRVATSRAGLILMGGGTDVDAAFAWQRDRIGGGDVVVLRTSGADGYNDYLFSQIGGIDSVETLLVDTRALAAAPYVRWVLDHAEAIFLAGGDQSTYVAAWRGTPVTEALAAALARGAVLGGTSAGLSFLAGIVYSARNGTVLSSEALADPYDARVTLDRDVLAIPALAGVITDSHFVTRNRMGRLLAFTARALADGAAARPLGLGVDERTALVVDDAGTGTVIGSGSAYALLGDHAPTTCAPGKPLAWSDVPLYELAPGDSITLPGGATAVSPRLLSAGGGVLVPADPY
jgi:cyanophycinase